MRLTTFASLVVLLPLNRAHGVATIISAEGPFAHNINGKIVCDEVVMKEGTFLDKNGDIAHDTTFSCLVNPTYTETGSEYIELDIINLDSSFEEEREAALAAGKTQLTIHEGLIHGSTIILPAHAESSSIACPTENLMHNNDTGEVVKCFEPILNWHYPPSDASRRHRKLAINQTGVRSILVFRITTTTNGAPDATSASVSDAVFGSTDTVTIASQYAACSNNKLDFIPAAPTGLSLSATGVHDITVTTTSASDSGDIMNAVKSAIGNSVLGTIDHKFYHMVSKFAVLKFK